MFPFKKKPAPAPVVETPKPTPHDEMRERVNRRLDDTCTRLDEAVREMKRRLEEKERRTLSLVAVNK